MKQMLIVLLVHLQTLVFGQQFTPVSFTLPAPPSLIGPLSPNYALYNAEKLHPSKIRGPTSFAFLHGNVYTVTADKRIVNIATCNPTTIATLAVSGCRSIAECGMLTSIRVDNNGKLVVLDAYKGLYRVDPLTGAIEQLYSSTVQVGGRTPKYLNDIVIKSDGTIFISDSSDKYDAANDMYIILEGRPSGRILLYSPDTKQTTEFIKDGIVYPNGLELAANETELLVSEMGRARLVRISLLPSTFRQLSLFSENLPGLPENIRRSSRNTFWVGISYVRHSGIPNSMDTYAGNPAARARTAYSVDQNTIKTYYPKYGLAIEVDSEGKPVGSLHDPTGSVFHSVTEAVENEGLLYVGSIYNRYTGRIVLPQGDNRMVTIDSVLQVLRSRCQIPEDRLVPARILLLQYINQSAANTTQANPSSL
ncbi:adipocyte plasma membrane-associated protein-like [Biomphalaria glabrata]|uniref:Adipocyte plasma membrane-associated protein-like n=1 Tax=Biomphalaria glabrata TaxID=6526 RepID=A0A9W3AMN0_BIOGL|nr:adipocyte plasma membrane-associated protein-like [Biomphalaria glabrata]